MQTHPFWRARKCKVEEGPSHLQLFGVAHWALVHLSALKKTNMTVLSLPLSLSVSLLQDLRWLDTVFLSEYLSRLSVNYVSINKDLEKLTPQLYYIKMKICYDQGCNDIVVVVATKWRHYLFYLQQYFSALGTVLPKSFTGAFSYNSRLDVSEV